MVPAMPRTLANLADSLNLRNGGDGRLPPLVLVTDQNRQGDPVAAAASLRMGDAILLRDYDLPERMQLARRLAAFCRARRINLVVGRDVALARAVGAQGVHLPEALIRCVPAVRAALPGAFVTSAAHGGAALVSAARHGVDAVFVSPVFATASHPGAPFLGAVRFAALCAQSAVPVYALGGLDALTASRLAGSGAIGIAAIGGFAATEH